MTVSFSPYPRVCWSFLLCSSPNTNRTPPEGRLHKSCLDLLHGSDIQFHRHSRLDIALCLNLPIALVFLPASDIPRFVGEGKVDLGITGRDQVAESHADVEETLELGFGMCKLQVQVPEMGEYTDPRQLIGKNIVTSFTGLVSAYFAKLEREEREAGGEANTHVGFAHEEISRPTSAMGMAGLKTKIKYVGGSVEAACALGVADGIVDLVGTLLSFVAIVAFQSLTDTLMCRIR